MVHFACQMAPKNMAARNVSNLNTPRLGRRRFEVSGATHNSKRLGRRRFDYSRGPVRGDTRRPVTGGSYNCDGGQL